VSTANCVKNYEDATREQIQFQRSANARGMMRAQIVHEMHDILGITFQEIGIALGITRVRAFQLSKRWEKFCDEN